MATDTSEQINEDQLRHIISSYLDEVVRCYEEQQRLQVEGFGHHSERLERKASELLEAMMASVDPDARRRAILQVLCRAREHHDPNLPS